VGAIQGSGEKIYRAGIQFNELNRTCKGNQRDSSAGLWTMTQKLLVKTLSQSAYVYKRAACMNSEFKEERKIGDNMVINIF